MANLNVHPAPGLGDLTSGFFVVPQNPLQMAAEGISRVPTLGEFIFGSFVVPQNPFWAYSAGQVQPIGQGSAGMPIGMIMNADGSWSMNKSAARAGGGGCGMSGVGNCGCGCGGSCGCSGGKGMGTITTDLSTFTTDLTSGNIMQAFQDTIFGIPVWGWLAGIVVLSQFMLAPSEGRSRVYRARHRVARAIAPA